MITVYHPDRVMTRTIRRQVVRGVAELSSGGPVERAIVCAIDRYAATALCAASTAADGSYRMQLPARFEGSRSIALLAFSSHAEYNAVVADRVMPETMIE